LDLKTCKIGLLSVAEIKLGTQAYETKRQFGELILFYLGIESLARVGMHPSSTLLKHMNHAVQYKKPLSNQIYWETNDARRLQNGLGDSVMVAQHV
jgi:hypothetical protein